MERKSHCQQLVGYVAEVFFSFVVKSGEFEDRPVLDMKLGTIPDFFTVQYRNFLQHHVISGKYSD